MFPKKRGLIGFDIKTGGVNSASDLDPTPLSTIWKLGRVDVLFSIFFSISLSIGKVRMGNHSNTSTTFSLSLLNLSFLSLIIKT